jgi:hypothetical protein
VRSRSRPIVALNGLFSARAHDLTRHIMAQGRAARTQKQIALLHLFGKHTETQRVARE